MRAASRRSRSTAISWVTPWSRSRRSSGQSPASASTASSQSDSTVSRTSRTACGAAAGGADREQRVRGAVQLHPVRAAPPGASAARCSAASRAQASGGQRRARDLDPAIRPSGRGEHPGAQVEVGAEQVEDHVRARRPPGPEVISRRCRSTTAARSPARSPETWRTTCSVMVANATDSSTANSGSRCRAQAATRSSGMSPSSASPAASPATPALHQEADERLGVGGVPAPGQAGEDQLAAGEIAARVAQVGGHDPADRTVQLVLAAEQPQAQRLGVQQCAQPHLVAAVLCRNFVDPMGRRRRSRRGARGPCPAPAVSPVFPGENGEVADGLRSYESTSDRRGQPTPSGFGD